MSRVTVLPRDLKPGDKIDRVNKDFEIEAATIAKVEKVRRFGSTAYRVGLVEFEDLPSNRKAWAENRHLTPFLLYPHQKVRVERAEA